MDSDDFGSLHETDDLEEVHPRYEELVPFHESSAYTYGCCDPVMNDTVFLNAVKEFVLQAQLEALEEMDGSCVSNHCGVRSHQLRAIYGERRLSSLNWRRDDAMGQTRFINVVDYSVPVRLIISSGHKSDHAYTVYPKGAITRAATNENQLWLGQNSLFDGILQSEHAAEDYPSIQNYWVYVDSRPLLTGGWWITISIGLPCSLNESGRRMETLQDRIIFSESVTLGADISGYLLPLAEVAEIDIRELDETDIDSNDPNNL